MSIVIFDGRERALHGDVRLDGREIDLVVGDALTSFDEELSIDGSPIMRLGLFDPQRVLLTSGLLDLRRDDADRLGREVELVVDNVAYWLRHVAKQGDSFTLTFEDRTVARLRGVRGAMRVRGGTITDRQFISRLCARAGVPAPRTADPDARELAAREVIGKTRIRRDEQQRWRDDRRAPGIADSGAGLTIKGARLDGEQVRNLNEGLTEALRHQPTPLALLTLVAAGIVESEWRNIQGAGADAISFGVLQNIPGRSAGVNGTFTREQALDVAYTVKSALLPPGPTSAGGLIRVSKRDPGLDPGTLADITINGVGVGDPGYVSKVNKAAGEARRIVAAFGGGDLELSSRGGFTIEYTRESPLTVERDESYWDAAVRIADERNARFFVVAGQPYYMYDGPLMRARPRMTLSEQTPGVDWIDWEWAPHKQLRRTDVQCRAEAWQAPPGSVVLLDESCGPAGASEENEAQGRWLVGEYRRDRFQLGADITLIKGRRPRVPTETDELTIDGGGTDVRVGRGGTTSPFGGSRRYPLTGAYGTDRGDHIHAGVDVGTPHGTPAIAPFDGRVTMATTSGFAGGGMIHVQALDDVPGTSIKAGDRIGWGHASAVTAKVGERVEAGTMIGRTGTSSNGAPHCHFVLLRKGGGGNGVDGNADPTADLRALGGLT